jgi:hypothetical protein
MNENEERERRRKRDDFRRHSAAADDIGPPPGEPTLATPIIEIERPRCAKCGSDRVPIYRTVKLSNGFTSRYRKCSACKANSVQTSRPTPEIVQR